ncbi:molybdate transport system permease protein [Abditibacterium utsteinense]|uniref:Molybdenum transport system permease n=1 Tax=Abditibacterium utsteinense TaxID=1960156 RepID=A0A2S8SQT0_9BACT|nr:molybdate ABC transporter permease subunit [Abditibacterium utsteinense]PQV63153.1 molybdate transport system permease protein [Abditibacterium utsteinense]
MIPDWHPLQLSLEVAAGALLLALPLGIGAASALRGRHFVGKSALESLFLLPLVLPPVVTGLVLLLLLGKRGPVGRLLLGAGFQILFTPWAAILAAAIVAFPLVFQSARAAFAGVDSHLEDAASAFGATRARVFWTITIPLSWPGLLAGATLSFARALGEFGATVMVAGNVSGRTLTAPVAIYFASEDGDLRRAGFYALLLGFTNFAFLLAVSALGRRRFSS